MIQIYAINNTDFDWNGDAVIDAISCESDITIGGSWELELEAPIDENGDFNYIQVGAVISVPSPSGGKNLLWSIYDREKGDQSVTAKARPIFMDSAKEVFLMDVRPVKMTAQQTLDKLMAGTKYSGVTDITTVNTAYYVRKNLIEALASDDDNSFVNRWGGEISYENFTVHVMSKLGEDRGLRVEFGRNIESISEKENNEELATRLVPVSYNGYTLPVDKPWVDSPRINDYPIIHTRILECKDLMLRADLEANGDDPDDPGDGNIVFDTLAELQQAMRERCIEAFAGGIDVPKMTYDVDMVDLSDKEEYQDYKDLEKALLGDTVHCLNKRLSIQRDARVVRVLFDHIKMVNKALTIGDYDGDYFSRLQNLNKKVEQTETNLHQLQVEFSIVNGKITSRIWKEDIDVAVDGLSASVDDKFSIVNQTVEEISTTVGDIKQVQDEHGRQIEENKSSITQTADSIRTEVSEKYSTKEETTEKVEAVQDAAAADATAKANKALSDAKDDTKERLKSYSTTTEMQSAIDQTAESITSSVSKTYSTKTELSEAKEAAAADATEKANAAKSAAASDATEKANKALSDAKADTDAKLQSYSTTEEMKSAIEQSADSITSTVTKTLTETYATKAYADDKASKAQSAAADDATKKADAAKDEAERYTDTKLESYSTTTQMQSAIEQSASSIVSSVSESITNSYNNATSYADTKIEQTVKGITLSAEESIPETFDLCEGCDWYTSSYPSTNLGQGEQILTPDPESSSLITTYTMTPKWYEHKISGGKLKLEIEYNVTKALGQNKGYILLSVVYIGGTSSNKSIYFNIATLIYLKGQIEVDVDPEKTISYVRLYASIYNDSTGSFKVRNPKILFTENSTRHTSHLTLSANGVEISSTDITIEGVVTFKDLSTPGESVIDGGNITTGSLSADRIYGGTLTLGGQNNDDGSMTIKNASGTAIGTINNDGINFSSGNIKLGSRFQAVNNGNLYLNVPYINGSIYMQKLSGEIIDPGNYIQVFSLLVDSQIWTYPSALFSKDVTVFGGFVGSGGKSRLVTTPDYSDRLLYCYEMPSPMFGDIGEGETDDNGECYIYLDDVFTETVSTDIEYQVFLQEEGEGSLIIAEKDRYYFVVKGTPGMKFSWEVKVKQRDYEYDRLELYDRYPDRENETINYENQYYAEIEELIRVKEDAVYEAA